jgi:hypothetical protein
MPGTNTSVTSDAALAEIRKSWLQRLSTLVDDVDRWAKELGWSTRRLEKQLSDPVIGLHQVPAILLQEGSIRVFVEPIARSAPGTEGVVDLYLMPAYDDIASLYFVDGAWRLHSMFPESTSATIGETPSKPLGKCELRDVLDAMKSNASQAV